MTLQYRSALVATRMGITLFFTSLRRASDAPFETYIYDDSSQEA